MVFENKRTNKIMAIIMIIAMIFSIIAIPDNVSYAEKKVLQDTVYYHLDIGVQLAYSGKDWSKRGYNKGADATIDNTIDLGTEIKLRNVYPLDSMPGSFNYEGKPIYSHNIPRGCYYDSDYKPYATSMRVTSKDSSGSKVSWQYKTSLSSSEDFAIVSLVKDYGEKLAKSRIYKPFGGESALQKEYPNVYSAISNAIKQAVDGTAANNELYVYFCPTVIEYQKYVTVGDLDADLSLPASAKQGESYTVSDASYIDDSLTVEEAILEKQVGSGEWEQVAVWEGTGKSGENTKGSVSEKSDAITDIKYRITVVTTNGQSDTEEKTISITDGRQIEAKAVLELDKYTYEGHPADAEDWSEFTVDGIRYSAQRAYEEKIAKNKFRTEEGTVKKDGYDAIVTYPKRGVYPVNLEVTLKTTGKKLTDTKNIEVRKTPYVMDSLGGVQKQNRKQTLTFNIATYPDKPLVDYDITIKDLKSNELISLTKAAPQENGACIKTRTVKSQVKDQYWTTLTVEFLTKYPRYDLTGDVSQRFSYRIKVTDSKGDSDEAYKEFDVAPDKPPIPAINMQTTFLRAEGTNTAKLQATDGSQSDGDQLLRTWSIVNYNPLDNKRMGDFVNATTVNGYENLAFGTNQTIGWNKEGVGKTTVKLHVKDVWTEPTLEEYIKPSDYLEAETTAGTEVINIAPIVSIEPLEMLKANIAIMVKANEYQSVQNQLNSLQASLIEKGIDGNVSLVKLVDGTKAGQATITGDNAYMGTYNCDSERMYFVHGGDSSSFKISAYDNDTAKEVWSYPIGPNNISSIYIDRNREKYVIANQTVNGTKTAVILDRNTGAYLTGISGAHLDGEVFLSNDEKRLYCVNDTGMYRLDLKTGQYKCVISDNTIRLPRMYNGKIGFSAKFADSQYYIGSFDMTTEQINKNIAPVYDYTTNPNQMGTEYANNVYIADWSNDGKMLIIRTSSNYGDDYGGDIWLVDTVKNTQKNIYHDNGREDAISGSLILDDSGNCRYAVATRVHRADAYKYYNAAYIYDLSGKLIASTSKTKTKDREHLNNGFYNSTDNTIYIFEFAFYGKAAKYNLTTGKWEKDWGSSIFDSYSGNLKTFDNGIFSFNDGNNDGRHESYYNMYFLKRLTSKDDIAYKALERHSNLNNEDNSYVAFMGMDNSNLPVTNEVIKETGAKAIHLDLADSFSSLADKVKELSKEAGYKLQLTGNKDNSASVSKEINLLPNTKYNYSYDMQLLSGSAIDTFTVQRTPDKDNGTKYYKEIVYQEDFTNRNSGRNNQSGVGSTTFTLQRNGYVSFKMNTDIYTDRTILIDGKPIAGWSYERECTDAERTFLAFLPAGTHTVTSSVAKDYNSAIKTIEAGHLSTDDNSFNNAGINLQEGSEGMVTGSFTTPKDLIFYKNETAYTSTKINGYDMVNKGYMTYDAMQGYGYITDNGNTLNVHSDGRVSNKGYLNANLYVRIEAPPDKKLLIKSSRGVFMLNEGESTSFRFTDKVYYANHGYSREFTVMSGIEAVEIPANNCPWFNDAILLGSFSTIAAGNKIGADSYGKDFYWIDTSTIDCKVYKCTIADPKDTNVIIGFSNVSSNNNLNVLISNLRLEMINTSKNAKGSQLINKFTSENSLNSWNVQTKEYGQAEMKLVEPVKKDEDAPLVYKKGQLVSYKIYYSDYEKDPSKSGYWLYAHTPYNDGAHPDAAIIYDEDGNIKSICGQAVTAGAISINDALNMAKSKGLKILDKPIDRFYVDGKYTVYHWESDDTSRNLVNGGFPTYDKVSNTAELTFYIEGSANAPWITGISTSPEKVIFDNYFSINVGIDDVEKDVLNLTTEVYKDKKLIFTHRRKNIHPIDALGQISVNGKHRDGTPAVGNITYPVTNTGALPDKADDGTYTVVCTVRDQTGANLGKYIFYVEGDKVDATVEATKALKSGYGISAKVKTTTKGTTINKVTATLPTGQIIQMVKTDGSGNNLTWEFTANTGKYAEIYNKKHKTISRQIFVPVKFPDKKNYVITYKVYDKKGAMRKELTTQTYVDGNMYDDDFTVKSK